MATVLFIIVNLLCSILACKSKMKITPQQRWLWVITSLIFGLFGYLIVLNWHNDRLKKALSDDKINR